MTAEAVRPTLVASKHYAYNEKRPRSEIVLQNIILLPLLMLGGLLALVYHGVTWSLPSTKTLVTAGVMYFIAAFGVSLGYHRLFTHGGYKTFRGVEIALFVMAGLSMEGPAIQWVRNHWYHHDRSDQPGDVHSPFQYSGLKGIAWSHMGWLFYKTHLPKELAPSREWILTDRFVKWQNKYYWVFMLVTFGVPTAIGATDGLFGALEGLFVAGFLRAALFLNVTFCINSVCHLWGKTVAVKYRLSDGGVVRTKSQGDGSRNNIWLAIWSVGESYHALHHLFAKVAYHGWSRWALDPTKWVLIAAEKLHLVWDVEKPPADAIVEEAAIKLPPDSLILSRQRETALAA
jgi:stearoyl-CoA desaturase (delta-9 desaturase)